MGSIADNMQAVTARIRAAETLFGRASGSVALLAVSKTWPAEAVRQAAATGQRAFGENYVQEGVEKCQSLASLKLDWHFIGPLQRNKTRPVAEHFDWVHSVDRWVIAERLSAQRPQGRGPLQVCLQVNVDEEESKHGLAPGDVQALVELARKIHPLPGLCLRGLMAIPAPSQDIAQQRQAFAAVRTLFDKVKAALPDTSRFDTLSMGMSHDLEAAIAEGASWVRVGTAIFGERA